jgi:hypothetical protein
VQNCAVSALGVNDIVFLFIKLINFSCFLAFLLNRVSPVLLLSFCLPHATGLHASSISAYQMPVKKLK